MERIEDFWARIECDLCDICVVVVVVVVWTCENKMQIVYCGVVVVVVAMKVASYVLASRATIL